MQFNALVPELYVSNLAKSLRFYVDILGFQLEYQRDAPRFAFLSYQSSQLMLQELVAGEAAKEDLQYPFGRGINFQIDTRDVDAVIRSLRSNNYPLKRDLRDSWYRANAILHGCREIHVLDPDGYLLRFSQWIGDRPAGPQ
jgi:catechol 2,3-dioxygenase-like lactoylglutathione lyase family enzyme